MDTADNGERRVDTICQLEVVGQMRWKDWALNTSFFDMQGMNIRLSLG